MSDSGNIVFSANTLTIILSICAVFVSGLGVWSAWKQSRNTEQQRRNQEQSQRFVEMREAYVARIDTLTATVDDLQDKVRNLERQNLVLTDHSERCEKQLAALQARLGFGGGSSGSA